MKQRKIVLVIASILTVLGFPVVLIANLPFTYSEMDLNSDGVVGLSEVMYFADYGTRYVMEGGQQCIEYYALKDGLRLKVVCNEH